MRLGFEGIPKEDEKVDRVVGDQRAELLVTTEGSALKFDNSDAELLLKERPVVPVATRS